MAFETGEAANWLQLRAKFLDFITTNADLVAAGQEWVVAWNAPAGSDNMSDLVLRGPGLAAGDAVYVAMRAASLPNVDAYWLDFRGASGVVDGAATFSAHVNSQPRSSRLYLDTQPFRYWFIANGRRFVILTKTSTVFQSVYAGLFLPFGSPVAYPYPLIVGGSAGEFNSATVGARNWRSVNPGLACFWDSYSDDNFGEPGYTWLLNPSGEWNEVAGTGSVKAFSFLPHDSRRDQVDIGRAYFEDTYTEDAYLYFRMRAAFGGQYPLVPLTLVSNSAQKMTYGVLDGVYKCQGMSNASENVIQENGLDHLVIQNCFRTDLGAYAAFALG